MSRTQSGSTPPPASIEDESGGVAVPLARSGRARGAEERTVQVSLRLPASWIALLRQRALAAAAAEEAMVTPQEIVRRMIADALKAKP
jgi:hypothetical protein